MRFEQPYHHSLERSNEYRTECYQGPDHPERGSECYCDVDRHPNGEPGATESKDHIGRNQQEERSIPQHEPVAWTVRSAASGRGRDSRSEQEQTRGQKKLSPFATTTK